jgi:hypothetical protein
METREIAQLVEQEFVFLREKYGFKAIVTRDHGREVFFDYERGLETISISFEIGQAPIIEVFIPSEISGEKAVPWAAKNGIQRSRRFPKLVVGSTFQSSNLNSVQEYIRSLAKAFEASEDKWLNA